MNVPTELPAVMADRARIIQVISNLLSNTAGNAQGSSAIGVRAEHDGMYVAVSVVAEGWRLPPDQLPYLFRKYSRIDGGMVEREIVGYGLGLSICKGIVEAHGGRIWAESESSGPGVHFTFTLPVADQATQQNADHPDQLVGRSHAGELEPARILVMEDDPQTLRHLRDVLSRGGYTTIFATGHNDVLHQAESEKPQLVLMDLALPGIDGFDLMGDIIDVTGVPVICLSAHGTDRDIERALDLGAVDYMVKPFSPTELTARIRAALRKAAAANLGDEESPFALGDMTIDYVQRRVEISGQPVHLTPIEYELLRVLSLNSGRVLTHELLLRRVWRVTNSGDPQVVRTHMGRLRRKLGDDADSPTYIFTEPRAGYSMPATVVVDGG